MIRRKKIGDGDRKRIDKKIVDVDLKERERRNGEEEDWGNNKRERRKESKDICIDDEDFNVLWEIFVIGSDGLEKGKKVRKFRLGRNWR